LTVSDTCKGRSRNEKWGGRGRNGMRPILGGKGRVIGETIRETRVKSRKAILPLGKENIGSE